MTVDTYYGEFTCRYFFNDASDEGLECKSEGDDIVILQGESLINREDFDSEEIYLEELEDLAQLITEKYEDEYL